MVLSLTLLIFWVHINSHKSQVQTTWGFLIVQHDQQICAAAEQQTLYNAMPQIINIGETRNEIILIFQ